MAKIDGIPAENIAETVRDIARKAAGDFKSHEATIDGMKIPLVGKLAEGRFELIDLKAEADKWRKAPERIKGTAAAQTLDSFIALVNLHKGDNTRIFAQVTASPNMTAVIDYSGKGAPAFHEHRISYSFPLSDEWKIWHGKNGAVMKQGEFAAFIEDHVHDLSVISADDEISEALARYVFAAPAELLTLARGLEISAETRVKNVLNLQTGEAQIVFEEQHRDGSGAPLTVPGAFMLAIPMFDGGHTIRIPARLRYRKQDAGLVWFYELYKVKQILREAVLFDVALASATTKTPYFIATPER